MHVRKCDICGITDPHRRIYWCKKAQLCLCNKHRIQFQKYGKIIDTSHISREDPNEIRIKNNYAEIILRNQKNETVGIAIIDKEDVDKCKIHKWYLRANKYVASKTINKSGNQTTLYLHRYIMNYNNKLEIDHINRNRLDNRKENLRIVDVATNRANNGCAGVTEIKRNGRETRWRAQINRYGKCYLNKYFKTKEEAIKAREEIKTWLEKHDKELHKEYLSNKEQLPTGISKIASGKYTAIICINNKKYCIGTYETKEQAVNARNAAIEKYKTEKAYA